MARTTNTQFGVAVHVLTLLAGLTAGAVASSDTLADSANCNPVYVRRVLGPLRRAGLVLSRPGAHGGWELKVDPASITLADIWQLLDGDDPVLGLHGPNPSCSVGRGVQATLLAVDRRVASAVVDELARHTIAEAAGLPAGQAAAATMTASARMDLLQHGR